MNGPPLRAWILALAVPVVSAACGPSPTSGTEPPFSIDVVAAVDGGLGDRVDPGQDVTVRVGQGLELFVQVVDARGRPAPVQSRTSFFVSNTSALGPIADFHDDRQGRRELVFLALKSGTATVTVSNPSVIGPRLVVVRVE